VFYLTPEQDVRAGEDFTEAAEFVMEVASPDDPARDYVAKRRDYAEAGVPEYWIIDAALRQVLILRLDAGTYVEHGRFGPGQTAVSYHLAGFAVSVDEVLSQRR
jgi:Uma2 family endonuclease